MGDEIFGFTSGVKLACIEFDLPLDTRSHGTYKIRSSRVLLHCQVLLTLWGIVLGLRLVLRHAFLGLILILPWISIHFKKRVLVFQRFGREEARLDRAILTLLKLFCILFVIHLLQSPHLFYLVEIHHEARLHIVQVLDALSTEYARMLAAVEVLYPLVMVMAKVWLQLSRVLLIFKLDICLQTFLEIY